MHTKQAVMLTLSPEIRFTQQRITLTAQNIGQLSAYEQWGNAGNNNGSVDVTFPISFTKAVYQIQLTYNNSSYENPTYEIKDTKSFSYWSKYGGDKLWLAIGAQQWGVVTDDRSTLTFLLPFSNSDYFYAAFPTNKVNAGGINLHGVRNPNYLELYSSMSNNSYTANNWQFDSRNFNPCWLAIGIQMQWGLMSATVQTITYPIVVSKIYSIVMTTKATQFRYAPWPSDITTRSFVAYSDVEPAWWMLIAKTQALQTATQAYGDGP